MELLQYVDADPRAVFEEGAGYMSAVAGFSAHLSDGGAGWVNHPCAPQPTPRTSAEMSTQTAPPAPPPPPPRPTVNSVSTNTDQPPPSTPTVRPSYAEVATNTPPSSRYPPRRDITSASSAFSASSASSAPTPPKLSLYEDLSTRRGRS